MPSKLTMVVTRKNLFSPVRAMTVFIYAPNVEGPHHGSDSALVPGKRGMQTIWQMYVTVEVIQEVVLQASGDRLYRGGKI